MTRKVIVQLFPRNKYPSSAGGRTFFPKDREKLKSLMGSANEIWIETRVYARDTNVFLDFDLTHATLGDESPAEGLRQFQLTKSGATPALPYDTTNIERSRWSRRSPRASGSWTSTGTSPPTPIGHGQLGTAGTVPS